MRAGNHPPPPSTSPLPPQPTPFLSDHLLLSLGWILITGSIGYFFILGNLVRLGMLGAGFLVLMFVALRRHQFNPSRHFLFIGASTVVFLVLLLLTYLQEHQTSPIRLIFLGVAFCLFIAGGLLGAKPWLTRLNFTFGQAIFLGGVAIPGVLALLRYTERISFYEVSRDFGESELNPVGLAYASSVLLLSLLIVVLEGKNIWPKLIAGGGVLVVLVTILISGSRGATLFLGFTILLMLGALAIKQQLNIRRILPLLILPIIGLVVFSAIKGDFILFERLEILTKRFSGALDFLSGQADEDRAIEGRFLMQQYYIQNWSSWLFAGQRYYSHYPHNQWMEWGVRFGIFGIIVGTFFLFLLLKANWTAFIKLKKIPGEFLFFYSLLVYSYLQSLTSLSLEMNRSLFMSFGYFVGFLLIRKQGESRPLPITVANKGSTKR